jgi:hypothetical protein
MTDTGAVSVEEPHPGWERPAAGAVGSPKAGPKASGAREGH